MTILLYVEDDEELRQMTAKRLSNEGYRVIEAIDGNDGFEKAKKYSPTLIISDINMPNRDGIQFFNALQNENSQFAATPFIFMTANSSQEEQIEGLNLGADGYLTKPVMFNLLTATIKSRIKNQDRQLALLKSKLDFVFEPFFKGNEHSADPYSSLNSLLDHYAKISKTAANSAINYGLINEVTLHVSNLKDASHASSILANMCADPRTAILGISELIINGIEHGNLGVGYKLKTQLLKDGKWTEEIERRLNLSENKGKYVTISARRLKNSIEFNVLDCGAGFQPHDYLDFAPLRSNDSHGRGIALANAVVFDQLKYEGKGNQVTAIINEQIR